MDRIEKRIKHNGYVEILKVCVLKDGVEREYSKKYEMLCQLCGEVCCVNDVLKEKIYVCESCKKELSKKANYVKKALLLQEIPNYKQQKRFDSAVSNIKRQVKDFSEYEKAVETARKRYEYYGSIPEAMVAIELLKNKYSIIPQQKIGNYKVDFAIPKQKIIIEVDGSVYHTKITERDAIIQFAIGLDWNIIHIPAEKISRHITKLQAIIENMAHL